MLVTRPPQRSPPRAAADRPARSGRRRGRRRGARSSSDSPPIREPVLLPAPRRRVPGGGGTRRNSLRLLDAAIAARPDDAELLHLRASARESLGDDDGALFDLETAAVADERHVDALLALHERVLERRRPAPSRPLPAMANVYAIRVIDVLMHARRFEEAARARTAARAKPDPGRRPREHGRLRVRRGQLGRAAETYRQLCRWPSGATARRLLRVALAIADACERAGTPKQLATRSSSALSKAPGTDEVMRRLERVCEATGDFARLANLLLAQAEREPREATAAARAPASSCARASFCSKARRTPRARCASRIGPGRPTQRASTPSSSGPRRRTALGRSATALGAITGDRRARRGKRIAALARLHLEIGRAHLAFDDIVEAFESLKAGFNLDWRNAEIAMLLGLVAIDLDDERLAERALSGLTTMPARRRRGRSRRRGAQASAFFHLASMAYGKGDRGKARRIAGKAIGVEAGHVAARALLDQIEPPGGSPGLRGAARAGGHTRSTAFLSPLSSPRISRARSRSSGATCKRTPPVEPVR